MLFWIVALAVWFIDRALKVWVVGHFVLGESAALIPGFFHVSYILNPGAAFGLLTGHTGLLAILSCAILAGLFFLQRSWGRGQWRVGLIFGMICGGALGNLYDRLTLGQVVDFIDVQIWPYIFNFADSMIVLGIIGILMDLFVKERRERATGRLDEQPDRTNL
ncbi:MAG: signal peptidase II [Peptococcaceae bacterium]|nr:signal peptidase II [Peptococcaceae bacterium]